MATDTKGYVLTTVKDVSHVMTVVERVISRLIAEALPGHRGWPLPEGFKHPNTYLSPSSDMAQTQFSIAGETRTLTVQFGCDSDSSNLYPGDKIVLSMGIGGVSEKLISGVLARLTHLGRCYFDRNDCDGQENPDVEVVEPASTFMAAAISRHSSPLAVKSWIRMHPVLPSAPALHEFLGVTPAELAEYQAGRSMYDIYECYREAAKGTSVTT